MVIPAMLEINQPRAVFLSDPHHGWRWARPHRLASLIGELSPESLYLVGALGARIESQGLLPPPNVKHWCSYWKSKSRSARQHVDRFRRFMCELAVGRGCVGVVCGHVHSPDNQMSGKTQYLNCGDWVEHQTFVVETERGCWAECEILPSAIYSMDLLRKSAIKRTF